MIIDKSAELHVVTALSLRWNPRGHLAGEDRALLRRIRAKEAIRLQGAPGPWLGHPRRTFFPCEPSAGVEMPANAPEASA